MAYSIWNLSFEERPKYEHMVKYFEKQIKILHTHDELSFDWNTPEDLSRLLSPQETQNTLNMLRPQGEAINYIPEVR